MNSWQTIFLDFLVGLNSVSLGIAIKKARSQTYSETPWLWPLGIFVWGDALILSLFWILAAAISLLFNNWILFLFITSVFWVVRGLGETIYWLNQQFSHLERNPPHTMIGHRLVKNDSVWYLYQIFWQSVTVFAVVFAVYFGFHWLH